MVWVMGAGGTHGFMGGAFFPGGEFVGAVVAGPPLTCIVGRSMGGGRGVYGSGVVWLGRWVVGRHLRGGRGAVADAFFEIVEVSGSFRTSSVE